MRRLALALVLLAPLAAAEPVSTYDESYGDCSTFGYRETSATAAQEGLVFLRAGGNSFCHTDPEGGERSSSSVFVHAAGPVGGWSYFAWSGAGDSGHVYASGADAVLLMPVPAGAPDPGWGRLLP